MPKQNSAPSEADLVFSRASLALAKSQRLIASWLPPKTAEENANGKTEEELNREEEEMFKVVPETLGLGAKEPTEKDRLLAGRTSLATNEKLKKQLFGKDWNKVGAGNKHNSRDAAAQGAMGNKNGLRNAPITGHVGPKPRPNASSLPNSRGNEDSDDDEGGRSSLGKSKKRKITSTSAVADDRAKAGDMPSQPSKSVTNMADQDDSNEEDEGRGGSQNKRRGGGSYLDQVLSERAKKKNKKRKKNADST